MRLVLYDYDLEPITIIECPHWRRLGLPEGEAIRVAWYPQFVVTGSPSDDIPDCRMEIVTIKFERLHRGEVRNWLAFTDEIETALKLKAAFLPGQYATVQERERQAFAKGFLHALQALG